MTVAEVTKGIDTIVELLGNEADSLLAHTCKGISRESIHAPGPDHLDEVWGIAIDGRQSS